MATNWVVTEGQGFTGNSPGSAKYMITLGYLSGSAAPGPKYVQSITSQQRMGYPMGFASLLYLLIMLYGKHS